MKMVTTSSSDNSNIMKTNSVISKSKRRNILETRASRRHIRFQIHRRRRRGSRWFCSKILWIKVKKLVTLWRIFWEARAILVWLKKSILIRNEKVVVVLFYKWNKEVTIRLWTYMIIKRGLDREMCQYHRLRQRQQSTATSQLNHKIMWDRKDYWDWKS